MFWGFICLILSRPSTDPVLVENQKPLSFSLNQNYPNPFNSSTRISYKIENPQNVELKIFGANGQHIDTIVDKEYLSKGSYSKIWSPSKDIASGTYFYRLKAGNYTESKKMMLVK